MPRLLGEPTDVERRQRDHIRDLENAAEMLWVVLANVSGSDWTQQTPEWQEAAARWRDNYFYMINQWALNNKKGK